VVSRDDIILWLKIAASAISVVLTTLLLVTMIEDVVKRMRAEKEGVRR